MHEDSEAPARVLFLCTHNSARSQMAEAILRHVAGGRVEAYSAGNEPGRVHPDALQTLSSIGINTEGLTSKHLKEYLGQRFDYTVTVCDKARESCPIFPGNPTQIHWSYPDPSAVQDPKERLDAFREIATDLVSRNNSLLARIEADRLSKQGDTIASREI